MTLNEFCMSFNDLVRHNEGNANQWKLNKENTIINARKCYFVCAVIQFKVCLNTFLKKQKKIKKIIPFFFSLIHKCKTD